MDGYIEIADCSAGFRVARVNEHFATCEHTDFAALEDARRFAEAFVVRDPSLILVDRTADAERSRPLGMLERECAVAQEPSPAGSARAD